METEQLHLITRDVALVLADIMDECSDDGEWNGGDLCDELSAIIERVGGWNTCASHGWYSAGKDRCPWCPISDATTEQARAERARAYLAGEHFAPGDDYGRWLADAPDEYGIPTTMVAEGRYKVCKYLLIEEPADSDAIYCTGHDDPDEAVNYHYNQEYPGDWTIREIVDLDTGSVHKVAAVKMVVTWELEG